MQENWLAEQMILVLLSSASNGIEKALGGCNGPECLHSIHGAITPSTPLPQTETTGANRILCALKQWIEWDLATPDKWQ
jgi:hypothetical protein